MRIGLHTHSYLLAFRNKTKCATGQIIAQERVEATVNRRYGSVLTNGGIVELSADRFRQALPLGLPRENTVATPFSMTKLSRCRGDRVMLNAHPLILYNPNMGSNAWLIARLRSLVMEKKSPIQTSLCRFRFLNLR